MEYLQKSEAVKKIKIMLDIQSDDYDEKLNFLVNLIIDEICMYTNRMDITKLPKKLENVLVDICVKYLKVNNLGIYSIKNNDAKSIKRGDTTIEFNTANILGTMKSVGYIEQELSLLNHFKRTKMA